MSDESRRARQVAELFERLADVPDHQLARKLDEVCAGDNDLRIQLERLILVDRDGRADSILRERFQPPPVSGIDPSALVGSAIDRYQIVGVVGEGGFGVVYEAEQTEPVRRSVALKIIKPGMDSSSVLARFEAERQALALMDHPCVAKVLDGGATPEGRPYFIMELVRGERITEFCDTRRLSLTERLNLFIRVCEAVQHAHQKGVIHRDLKPSNILITSEEGNPTPHIIDFGIAKALDQQLTDATLITAQGQLVGTPEYMCPEQAASSPSEVDTRADVYSLGAILYELLTGALPFGSDELRREGLAEIARIIREDEPPKPSTRVGGLGGGATRIAETLGMPAGSLAGILRRDLDWVVLKCLEKDRERRYETANALAMDLRRFLSDEPVLAGPPSAAYRIRKFAKRHKTGVVFGALFAVVLSVATGVSITFAVQAERARRAEAERSAELQQVAEFQAKQFDTIEPEILGSRLRISILDSVPEHREELSRLLGTANFTTIGLDSLRINVFEPARGAIDTQFSDQPLVRMRLLKAASDSLGNLGLYDAGLPPQLKALEISRRVQGESHPGTVDAMIAAAILHKQIKQFEDARSLCQAAIDAERLGAQIGHENRVAVRRCMASILQGMGEFWEAEPFAREAVELCREHLDEDHTLDSVNTLGSILSDLQQYDESEQAYRLAIEGRSDDSHSKHYYIAVGNLGNLLWRLERHEEAVQFSRESFEGFRRLLGDDNLHTIYQANNLGIALEARNSPGDLVEAGVFKQMSLDARIRIYGEYDPRTLVSMNNMCHLYIKQERWEEAVEIIERVIERALIVWGPDHINTGHMQVTRGRPLLATERFADAVDAWIDAHRIYHDILGPTDSRVARVRGLLAEAYEKWSEAEPGKGYGQKAAEWNARTADSEAEPAPPG